MLSRLLTALSLALLGVFGATGQALAAKGEDADEVQLWMAAAIAGAMALLALIYAVKWYFGVDSHAAGPDADDHAAHH